MTWNRNVRQSIGIELLRLRLRYAENRRTAARHSRENAEALSFLRSFLSHVDTEAEPSEVICRACASLGNIGTEEDAPLLERLAKSRKRAIRECAVFNLQRIRARDGKLDYAQYARRLRAQKVANRAVFTFADGERFTIRYRGARYTLAGEVFATADELLDAALFDGKSLTERWKETRFVSVDGFHPEDWYILFGSQPNLFM